MKHRIPLLAVSCAAMMLALASCSAQPDAAPTPMSTPSSTAPAPTSSPTPETVASESPEEPIGDPTCETLIAHSTIEIFDEHGWTHREDEFRIGGDVIEGGLQCVWGDYSVASDNVQIFGWAPLGAAESASAQQRLVAEGWIRADQDGRMFITEDPNFSIALDEAGFGMTYEFGDGWVTLADTKQSLVLIERP